MSAISKTVMFFLASLLSVALIASGPSVVAKDKDKKEKKDDKKDPKKDDKKEEKKPEFKPDKAAQEFKYEEKDKTFWVFAVAFGGDGKSVASTYRNHSIIVWDLGAKKAGQTIKVTDVKGVGDFRSLIYAGDQLYVGSGHLLKVAKEKPKDKGPDKDKGKDKDKDKAPVKERPFREGEIKTFDAKSGKPGKSLNGHALNIDGLAISKDGKFLASASEDGTVKIWDLSTGADKQTIKGHTDDVPSVSFSPDGKRVVTTSKDRTLRVFEVADAKEVALFKVEREIEKKDPKGKVTKEKEVGREFTRALFTADGKRVIAGNLDGVIKIYDVDGKKEVQELKAHEGVWALALSTDGKIATGGFDGTIKIWAADGKELKTIKAHINPTRAGEPGTVTSVSFSPDGLWLASGGIDGTVKVWSVK